MTVHPDKIRAQETRQRIYEYVKNHPGTHIRKIEKELGLAWGDLEYHIHKLSEAGAIKTRRSGLYKFVFLANIFGEKQEVVLGILSQETPREILLYLIQNPGATQKEIAGKLRYSPSTIWWHMDRLLRLGIVGRTRNGKTVMYEVITSRSDILNYIRHYHPGTLERWGSNVYDIVLMLSSGPQGGEDGREKAQDTPKSDVSS